MLAARAGACVCISSQILVGLFRPCSRSPRSSELYAYSDAKSRLEGLYLTGEFTLVGGFVGSMASGVITAYKILGLPSFLWTLLKMDRVKCN